MINLIQYCIYWSEFLYQTCRKIYKCNILYRLTSLAVSFWSPDPFILPSEALISDTR